MKKDLQNDTDARLMLLNAMTAYSLDLSVFTDLEVNIQVRDFQSAADDLDHHLSQGHIDQKQYDAISLILG